MKFVDCPRNFRDVAGMRTPGQAASAGRDRKRPLRSDWERVKEDVMYAALRAKFTQNKDCYEELMQTRGLTLVEHTANDSYWGDGGDPHWTLTGAAAGECLGKNRLGTLLTKLRIEFEADAASSGAIPSSSPTSSTSL
ncbi:N-glycosidase YbiA [Diplonema papillatum]|nr:N-glycosidase YbiA [Diplonema papillatum]